MAFAASEGNLSPALPLATLIGRELRGDGTERPHVRYGHSGFAKRGEDYFLVKPDCLRVPGDPSSSFSVFAVGPLFPLRYSFGVSFGFGDVMVCLFGLTDLRFAGIRRPQWRVGGGVQQGETAGARDERGARGHQSRGLATGAAARARRRIRQDRH